MPFHSTRVRKSASWSGVTSSRAAIRCDVVALALDVGMTSSDCWKRVTAAIYRM
jgi:hypothetical protein